MLRLRVLLPLGTLAAGLMLTSGAYGNIQYNKREKRTCVTCHTSVKGQELNAVGKCYQKKKTLAGCEPKA